MEDQGYREGSESQGHDTRDPGASPGGKRDFEAKLDEVAEKVSRTVSDGVKRLEEAAANIEHTPEFSEGRVKKFFTSSMGGLVVTIIGVLWFFNAVGLFRNWVVGLIVAGVGIWMIYKFKPEEPKP